MFCRHILRNDAIHAVLQAYFKFLQALSKEMTQFMLPVLVYVRYNVMRPAAGVLSHRCKGIDVLSMRTKVRLTRGVAWATDVLEL